VRAKQVASPSNAPSSPQHINDQSSSPPMLSNNRTFEVVRLSHAALNNFNLEIRVLPERDENKINCSYPPVFGSRLQLTILRHTFQTSQAQRKHRQLNPKRTIWTASRGTAASRLSGRLPARICLVNLSIPLWLRITYLVLQFHRQVAFGLKVSISLRPWSLTFAAHPAWTSVELA